jgi:hypothetical protein
VCGLRARGGDDEGRATGLWVCRGQVWLGVVDDRRDVGVRVSGDQGVVVAMCVEGGGRSELGVGRWRAVRRRNAGWEV